MRDLEAANAWVDRFESQSIPDLAHHLRVIHDFRFVSKNNIPQVSVGVSTSGAIRRRKFCPHQTYGILSATEDELSVPP
jgi:hypothetical protein